jgi:hypothetical protein
VIIKKFSPAPPLPCSPAQVSPAASIDAEALLQASRRLDWRFLLPDPNLGRVAYLGPAQGELVEALRLFSASLTVIELPLHPSPPNPPKGGILAPPSGGLGGPYDVVMAHEPAGEMLPGLARLVRPGGFLYIEAHGLLGLVRQKWPLSGLPARRWRTPAGYAVALKGLGCDPVQIHWHWPDFESCTKIIPLHDQGALLFALGAGGNDMLGRLKRTLGRGVVRSGLLARLVPCFSLVAQRRRS